MDVPRNTQHLGTSYALSINFSLGSEGALMLDKSTIEAEHSRRERTL